MGTTGFLEFLDKARWGVTIQIIIAIVTIVLAYAGVEKNQAVAAKDIENMKIEQEQMKTETKEFENLVIRSIDSLSNQINRDLLEHVALQVMMSERILPTLERIENHIEKVDSKIDRHMERTN